MLILIRTLFALFYCLNILFYVLIIQTNVNIFFQGFKNDVNIYQLFGDKSCKIINLTVEN